MHRTIVSVLLVLVFTRPSDAQTRVEKNIIYGMYSGLALLMDVHRPEKPNGYGVIFVSGSGWQAPLAYGAVGLKEAQIGTWGPPLLNAGYTIFAINHRATPRFQYPAGVEDVQRAVRFVRHNARQFGVDPTRLGAVAGSSGAHLIGLVALLAHAGVSDDSDPVNREAATLQSLVLRAAPTDLRKMSNPAVVLFMGQISTSAEAQKLYSAASPITHVSSSSPPILLLHGDSDDTVPFEQSVAMEAALRRVNVPVKLVRVLGGEHGPNFGTAEKPHADLPRVFGETVAWLDAHLKARSTSSTK